MMTVGSLFSGIGGFELGLERTGGFKTAWQCEIDPFCLKVLAKHWPDVKRFTDIEEMKEDIPYVDVICGGFPCQPVSCAGKRMGKEDERWLWPEFYRIVCEVNPRWVLVENVPGLLSADSGRLFAGILRDLASSGYDAEWNIVSAASVGAPHLRKRVFIVASKVADTDQIRRHGRSGMFGQGGWREPQDGSAEAANTDIERLEEWNGGNSERGSCTTTNGCNRWSVEPRLGLFTHGLSEGLADAWRPGWEDGTPRVATGQKDRVNRLRALGNAIVPPCAEYVGRCVLAAEGYP